MAYRTTQHKSTGCTPNLIFLQREIYCLLNLMVGPPPNTLEDVCPIQYIEWIKSAMALTHDFVFKNLQAAATRQKTYHDRDLKPRNYKIGDWVWHWYPPTAGQKLGLSWTGPYLVINCISDVTYSVQKSENSLVLNLRVDHLKPYEGRSQPRNWLNETDNTNIADLSHAANTGPSNITDRAEHDCEIDRMTTPTPTCNNETVNRQTSDIPEIRSRRERQIKPRQIWSPS